MPDNNINVRLLDFPRPPLPTERRSSWYDSFKNFISGLGMPGRDKAVAACPTLQILSQLEVHNLYRGDWLSRKIIDIPAFDATRAWRAWQANKNQIAALEKTERDFGLQRKVQMAITKARLYGGSAIILGIDGTGDFNEELDINKVGKGSLRFLHVVERWMLGTGPLVRDITSPYYGQPEYYMRSNTPISPSIGGVTPIPSGANWNEWKSSGGVFYIHPSRVIRFTGNDYPDMELAPDPWGDSVLQTVYDAVRDAGLVGQSIASLTSRANVNVIHVPGLTEAMQTDAGTSRMQNRFANANVAQSVVNAILLDDNEKWEQLSVQFAGLPDVHQMYLLIACGAADIPSTRLLGREPAGQNATGDSDTRNYYDRLFSELAVKYTPLLSPMDEVMIRSTFGRRDPNIFYNWNPLWQLPTDTKVTTDLNKAKIFQIDFQSGLFDPDVLAVARENQLIEDGTYPGLEAALEEKAVLEAEMGGGDEVDEDKLPNNSDDNTEGRNVGHPDSRRVSDYDPDEERDYHGRFGSGGGPSAETQAHQSDVKDFMKHPAAQSSVARTVGSFIHDHLAGLGHYVSVHKLVLPAVEGALVAGLNHLGFSAAENAAVTVAAYTVSRVASKCGFTEEFAQHMLHQVVNDLRNTVDKIGTGQPLYVHLPEGGMLDSQSSLRLALDQLADGLSRMTPNTSNDQMQSALSFNVPLVGGRRRHRPFHRHRSGNKPYSATITPVRHAPVTQPRGGSGVGES